nr:Photosystem II protein D1 [Ipomoea batatas]GMC53135.1 Photosystem II protein D1 [Ipomoea batatas]
MSGHAWYVRDSYKWNASRTITFLFWAGPFHQIFEKGPDHPLGPATDHRIGKLLPHQLANQTRAPPRADSSFCSSAYVVLAAVSSCCSPPKGSISRFARVVDDSKLISIADRANKRVTNLAEKAKAWPPVEKVPSPIKILLNPKPVGKIIILIHLAYNATGHYFPLHIKLPNILLGAGIRRVRPVERHVQWVLLCDDVSGVGGSALEGRKLREQPRREYLAPATTGLPAVSKMALVTSEGRRMSGGRPEMANGRKEMERSKRNIIGVFILRAEIDR